MQARSVQFDVLAKGYVRPLTWNVQASFDKAFDEDIIFFTLDESLLDGVDILASIEGNIVQEWDKYTYTDYKTRAVSLEVTREETEPYSVVQAYGDVTFNNYDDYFTPNSGSPIDQYILPRRPFRIGMGFGNESLQQIVGLTARMPEVEKSSRTASFHIIDFMSYLLDQDIGETIMLTNVRTHEVLDYLLQYMGLLEAQYVLDDSLNEIKFFFVEKGARFGDIVHDLLEAEIGRLYLDELGVIRFKNRYSYETTPVYTFDKSNTIDYSVSDDDLIINSVKITSDVREVQALQSVWAGSTTYRVPVGQSLTVFAQFNDPVTTINDPVYSATELNDSYFTSALNDDSSGVYTDITLTSLDLFSTTAKLMFQNTGSSIGYITAINLYGTPAKVVDTILVEEKDQDSIDEFDEQVYEIENNYIQDRDDAVSRALILLNDYKEYGSVVDLAVKGNPALQLGDPVTLDLDGYQGLYMLTKEVNITAEGGYNQRLKARKKVIPLWFTLDESVLDGGAVLAP